MGQFVHLSSSWFLNVHDPRAFFEKLPSIPLKLVPHVNLRKGQYPLRFLQQYIDVDQSSFWPFSLAPLTINPSQKRLEKNTSQHLSLSMVLFVASSPFPLGKVAASSSHPALGLHMVGWGVCYLHSWRNESFSFSSFHLMSKVVSILRPVVHKVFVFSHHCLFPLLSRASWRVRSKFNQLIS